MKGVQAAVATCIVIAVAAVALSLVDRKRQSAEMADLQKRVASLSVSTASAEEAPPSSPYRAYEPAPAPPVAAPTASAAPAPALASKEEARPAPAPAEVRDSFEIAFGGDKPDPGWTGADQRRASQKIQAALPEGSHMRSFDCRASLCRIETSHEDPSHYRAFVRAAFLDPETQLWNAGMFSTRSSDEAAPGEPLVMVSYLAREGQALPNIE
jgi:hypothetical protein